MQTEETTCGPLSPLAKIQLVIDQSHVVGSLIHLWNSNNSG